LERDVENSPQNLAIDGKQLFCGLRVFALELDGCLTIAKAAKGYDSPALQGELSIKIKGETLANKDVGEILIKIIKDSFRREHEFEVTQLNKGINEDQAYIVVASSEQKAKIQKYHVSIDNELVIPIAVARRLSAKEVTKKNCLVLIAKNLNLTQPVSDVARCIRELLGEKLIVDIYFSRA
jgi:hypothetical protein